MSPRYLLPRLRRCWNAETSASPEEWTPDTPSLGQCAVTALVVQDRFGGELLRTTVKGASHYLNRLPSGELVDLTWDQFPGIDDYDAEPEPRNRDYVLSFPATAGRYDLLSTRLAAVERGLRLVPISLRAANAYVREHHRHSLPTQGHKFSLGVAADGELVGVAIVGRPVSKALDDGRTLEVLRVCTTGARNACSFLYGASRRAIKALGYHRAITYTLESEDGASVRAAGFSPTASVPARGWSRPRRQRDDAHSLEPRVRWEVEL